jgi:glucose-6-phosphate isomerase
MLETSSVLLGRQPIGTVSQDVMERLKQMAVEAPLKRARLCLHSSHEDAVQEMVIALHQSTYIRPHRHQNGTESFHMIEGSVLIGFFEETGEIRETLQLQADRRSIFLYRLSASFWHTVLPLTEFAVFHEVAKGPFTVAEYPAWEPENEPHAIQQFKNRVMMAIP